MKNNILYFKTNLQFHNDTYFLKVWENRKF